MIHQCTICVADMPVNAHPSFEKSLTDISCQHDAPESKSYCRAAIVDRLPFALSYVASLEPQDRAILFYDNLVVAAEYFCSFIEEGMRRKEVTCLTGLEPTRYQKLFEQVGIKVAELENGGYLRNLSDQDFYREIARGIWPGERAEVLAPETMRQGGAIRFIHIHEVDSKQHDSFQNLIVAERGLHALSTFPATSICCYDARFVLEDSPSDFFRELLKAHDHCLFQGIAMTTGRLLGVQRDVVYPRSA